MRILTIVSYYKPAYIYGGPVKSISTMCEALAGLGQEVTVLTTNANGPRKLDVPLGVPVDVGGVKVVYYPVYPGFPASFYFSPGLIRAVEKHVKASDIVTIEGLYSSFMGTVVAACLKWGIPYIFPPRGQLLPWSMSQGKLKKKLYFRLIGNRYLHRAAAIHCTDDQEAETVKKMDFHSPVFIVPNGIDTQKYFKVKGRGTTRSKYGIPFNAIVLLFIGRLHKKKRPDIAIQAFAEVHANFPNSYLLMCGPDEAGLTHQLKAEAQALDCADHVIFTGLVDGEKIPQVLADVDLFLMPSEPQSENFGMSAIEAMAAGVPALVSEGVPVGKQAARMGACRVVPASVDGFREAATDMLSNMKELNNIAKRGQSYAQQYFDIHTVAIKMLTQLDSIQSTGLPLPND